jgi:DNA-binding transcriptional MerR regulator
MPITAPRAPPETLTITQLCRHSGATPRALRFYEQKGLLSPRRRKDQVRIYSHREKARLQLILRGRRAGFTLKEIRELFEAYDKGGRDTQRVRALPLFRERVATLELKRKEIDDALEVLKEASQRLTAKLGATAGNVADQSTGVGEAPGQALRPQGRSPARQPLRDVAAPTRGLRIS